MPISIASELPDVYSIAERMMALFAGHPDVHGTHREPELDSNGIKWGIKNTARTLRSPITVELWRLHLDGVQPLGVVPIRPDNTCVWGSIDYDEYDDDMLRIVEAVHELELPLVPCRSKSGGLHLFLFLAEPQPAGAVQTVLRELAAQLGVAGSEIFPKQTKVLSDRGDLGNWMVMPYFGGDYGGKLRAQVGLLPTGAEYTREEFLDIAENKKLSATEFAELSGQRRKRSRTRATPFPPFGDGPPCLEHLVNGGFPQGGRNNGLFMMGLYLKKKAPGTWQRDLEQINHQHMQPPLSTDEVQQVIHQLERKDYEYTCNVEPMCSHCDRTLCRTRKFGISNSGMWPTITGIIKMQTEPPIWFVDVDGQRIELNTEQLINYVGFNKVCMDVLDRCFLPMKVSDWNAAISKALESLQTIEAPPDVAPGGFMRELLEEFLVNRARGQRKEDLLTGRPWLDEETGRHYFRMKDLMQWLKRQGMRDIKHTDVIKNLQRLHGGHDFFNVNGQGCNTWWVPRDAIREPIPFDKPSSKKKDAV